MRKEVDDLWRLIEPPIEGAGLELVELEWNREAEGWVLRAYIDYPEGPRIPGAPNCDGPFPMHVGHEDCERVSREISTLLDVSEAIRHAYRLEVSSPGIDRPLRRERDFARFAGQQAKIRTSDPVDGRRNFSGVLLGVQDGNARIECDGKSYQLPLTLVVRANLVPDWEAEFRRSKDQQPSVKQGRGPGSHPTPRRAS
jgi:ribosome maturation factor RimP